ncbi:hypothetical protein GCM10022262_14800 [Georgenia daeguensis]|uniref:Uncharacterized protein n=1 Tax=Georgenia daeguensis TaxID=908355 RepID=A0ABP8ET41_9MICO
MLPPAVPPSRRPAVPQSGRPSRFRRSPSRFRRGTGEVAVAQRHQSSPVLMRGPRTDPRGSGSGAAGAVDVLAAAAAVEPADPAGCARPGGQRHKGDQGRGLAARRRVLVT